MTPTDTVTALLNIRQNATRNVAPLFNLQAGSPPYQPVNSYPPADYTLPITTVLASAPAFSVPGGSYTAVQSVTITDSDASAQIRYTTDGTTPGASSTLYTAAVSINQTTTLQAIAIDGSARSTVTSATYSLSNLTPTVSVANVTVPYQSTTAVAVTALSNANGSVVTFGRANGVDGSFNPATCTIASGTCTVNYAPHGRAECHHLRRGHHGQLHRRRILQRGVQLKQPHRQSYVCYQFDYQLYRQCRCSACANGVLRQPDPGPRWQLLRHLV